MLENICFVFKPFGKKPINGDVYQLHKDGTINQQRFDNAYAQSKMIMHHVYDDRGGEIICTDKVVHDRYVEK